MSESLSSHHFLCSLSEAYNKISFLPAPIPQSLSLSRHLRSFRSFVRPSELSFFSPLTPLRSARWKPDLMAAALARFACLLPLWVWEERENFVSVNLTATAVVAVVVVFTLPHFCLSVATYKSY